MKDARSRAATMPKPGAPLARVDLMVRRNNGVQRLGLRLSGVVQGVGFRPWVHALATQHGLTGFVRNHRGEVWLEVQGRNLEPFVLALTQPPAPAGVDSLARCELPLEPDERQFTIVASTTTGDTTSATVPPDLATCSACVAELEDPRDRRHRYPFIACTRCGPRFSIALALPYDRVRTTMAKFELCSACTAEYRDPSDRRFHAQPLACPSCGPTLTLLTPDGDPLARGEAALARAVAMLKAGRIVALKSIGGFALLCDASDEAAVARLRQRKQRPDKPLALMVARVSIVERLCSLSTDEEWVLTSPAAPIVLLHRRPVGDGLVAPNVAPSSPWLGVMLPPSPLHHLMAGAFARPLVCTSGNASDEPICTTTTAARRRLHGIADTFLTHDRPIARALDDSVVRVGPSGPELLRRARGFVPRSLAVLGDACVLGLGGHLKNTVTLVRDGQALVGPHVGDLGTPEGLAACERVVEDLLGFLAVRPEALACDLHPDYGSTTVAERLAARFGVPLFRIQHHHAHIAACMAEHRLTGPVLGLAWDGAGLGPDGSLWGGEALVVDERGYRRVAHVRPFRLPGGERALREPPRVAAGLLYELFGAAFAERAHCGLADTETQLYARMLARELNSPWTTSVGRLFDAVAGLLELSTRQSFEGQAALALETLALRDPAAASYPLPLRPGQPAIADWEPLVLAVLVDRRAGVAPATIAARFHGALVELAETMAVHFGLREVVLSGGCFHNARLAAGIHGRLSRRGFSVYSHRHVPTNDGGLSLGQAHVGQALLRRAPHFQPRPSPQPQQGDPPQG